MNLIEVELCIVHRSGCRWQHPQRIRLESIVLGGPSSHDETNKDTHAAHVYRLLRPVSANGTSVAILIVTLAMVVDY